MAGHSHSANIARRKNAVDAKRGKLFSKLARAIISAARQGGGDPEQNLKLKYAIEKAKAGNMPKDNIERAIKSGSGAKDGDDFEELNYEGYAPCGVAVLVSTLTDNRKRTAPEVKYTFEHHGGNMGASGSVAFMFDFMSIFVVETAGKSEDEMMEIAIESGADDVQIDEELSTITAAPTEFLSVKEALEAAELVLLSAETGYLPQNTIKLETEEEARKVLKLLDALEENDDVQSVYANHEFPEGFEI
jgi:YebC/PmpR family DNA-binding regulatory protein